MTNPIIPPTEQPGEIQLLIGIEALKKIQQCITAASKSINMVSYLATAPGHTAHIAYRNLWQTLDAAPQRGLVCRAIFARGNGDSALSATNKQATARLQKFGWHCTATGGAKTLHAKIWIFDQKIAIIGSHNLTEAGLMRNHETAILITQAPIIARLLGLINSIEPHYKPV